MAAICQLSFQDSGKQQINAAPGLMDEIIQIAQQGRMDDRGGDEPGSDQESLKQGACLSRAAKHAKRTLFNLKKEKRARHAAAVSSGASANSGPGHVMLSYAWGPQDHDTHRFPNQDVVLQIKKGLEEAGHTVWMVRGGDHI